MKNTINMLIIALALLTFALAGCESKPKGMTAQEVSEMSSKRMAKAYAEKQAKAEAEYSAAFSAYYDKHQKLLKEKAPHALFEERVEDDYLSFAWMDNIHADVDNPEHADKYYDYADELSAVSYHIGEKKSLIAKILEKEWLARGKTPLPDAELQQVFDEWDSYVEDLAKKYSFIHTSRVIPAFVKRPEGPPEWWLELPTIQYVGKKKISMTNAERFSKLKKEGKI